MEKAEQRKQYAELMHVLVIVVWACCLMAVKVGCDHFDTAHEQRSLAVAADVNESIMAGLTLD